MKVCFVSSSGGHWEELMCLREIVDEYDVYYVTEDGGQALEARGKKVYTFPQINRHERHFPIHFMKLFFQALKVTAKEKPDIVISTGALVSYFFCLLGKMRGAKVIFIESFARIDDASLTGKLVYPIADLFLVQWKPMLKVYKKARYVGGIF